MDWIDVNDALPIHGQAVLVRYRHNNWFTEHTLEDGSTRLHWRWKAAQFIMGRTIEEAAKIGVYREQDQWCNNKKPYCWREFGPHTLFGQDVTHWCPISDPCDEINVPRITK